MNTFLGIELGSTRIKAVAVDETFAPVSSGDYTWKSTLENGIWTYDMEEAFRGVRKALSGIDCRESVAAVGLSGMMHGYLAFDKDWNLLVPFRTWQNTITAPAAARLTEEFGFNIPQRWSIAHLYQAILNEESHLPQVAHITTLAGYVHYRLTGENVVGIGEASGIFPIDSETGTYDAQMVKTFNRLIAPYGLPFTLLDVLPVVRKAGQPAGNLTKDGAALLDNLLPEGTAFAPPEGDGGTGMVATCSIAPGTGNVSAGTSIFAMVVLDKPLEHVYEEIDMVTTPVGDPVAMVHCNNCTSDSNAWVSLLKEAALLCGADVTDGELYRNLYERSLQGEADCGGLLVCNYMAGEGVTHLDSGIPLVARRPDANFTLANFFRATLYSALVTLKLGMDILTGENICIQELLCHGGLFKTPVVGQSYMAAAVGVPTTVMETAGEGGAYGMALLAAFMNAGEGKTLQAFLNDCVFKNAARKTLVPNPADVEGFDRYTAAYRQLLAVETVATQTLFKENV